MAQRNPSPYNKTVVPARPAPPPPNVTRSKFTAKGSLIKLPPSTPNATFHLGLSKADSKKKPPPPRPPPPKLTPVTKLSHSQSLNEIQPKTVLFVTSAASQGDLLIDWNSPPSSPTPGRSSSDGISIRSFNSDSSCGVATGETAVVGRSESGFESESDWWNESTSSAATKNVTGAVQKPFVMPTIIRPNRSKTNLNACSVNSIHLEELEKALPTRTTTDSSPPHLDYSSDDYSPPEPSIPPPAPPPSIFVEALLPFEPEEEQPYAVALHTYHSTFEGDLSFQEGSIVFLERRVNEEWFYGRYNSKKGMFPANFVEIKIPLKEDTAKCVESSPLSSSYKAIALYSFKAETSEDLSLQEGDTVEVSGSLGNGWLYGSIDSRQGQFPESFVRRIS